MKFILAIVTALLFQDHSYLPPARAVTEVGNFSLAEDDTAVDKFSYYGNDNNGTKDKGGYHGKGDNNGTKGKGGYYDNDNDTKDKGGYYGNDNNGTNGKGGYHSKGVDNYDGGVDVSDKVSPLDVDDAPMFVPDYDVEFRLFTRSRPVNAENVTLNNATEQSAHWLSAFLRHKKIVVVTHGFRGSGNDDVCTDMRDAYLYKYDVNFIIVHWENLARFTHYFSYEEAVNHTAHVARRVARLLDYIVDQSPATADDFHLIGFSLGAHVMGQAGQMIAVGRVAHITGLDPAKPFFETKPAAQRLDATDARFVDVIHAETLMLGFKKRMGHVDIYPNGGVATQPACIDAPVQVVCSHQMAWRYYVASVYHPHQFVAQRCDSWDEYINATRDQVTCPWPETAIMGPEIDISARGMYFLSTLAEAPYFNTTPGDVVNTSAHNTTYSFWLIQNFTTPPPGRRNDTAATASDGVGDDNSINYIALCLFFYAYTIGLELLDEE